MPNLNVIQLHTRYALNVICGWPFKVAFAKYIFIFGNFLIFGKKWVCDIKWLIIHQFMHYIITQIRPSAKRKFTSPVSLNKIFIVYRYLYIYCL